jgi:hypothetical protein
MDLAAIRPDDWNLSLFFHVLGAMAFVASLIVALYSLQIARTKGDGPAVQFAFRVLLRGVLPSYLVMRVFAQIVESKEKPDEEAAWLGIGYITSDLGALLLIISLIVTGLAARKAKNGQSMSGAGGLLAATVLAGILIAASVVAVWAMTTKPV